MLTLMPKPKTDYEATPDSKTGVIRYRHPWVTKDGQKGVLIVHGVKKRTPKQGGAMVEDAQKLIRNAVNSPLKKVGSALPCP